MKILDTDLLVAILRGKNEALDFLDGFSDAEAATTSVNSFELFKGAFKSPEPQKNVGKTTELLSALRILSFDDEAAKIAGEIYSELEKKGKQVKVRDCLIASIALSKDATLVTRNIKHFSKINGLNIQQW